MSAYIMDVVCYMTPFPLMSWSWNPACEEPIHVYHSKLWEENVKDFFYEICHYVVIPSAPNFVWLCTPSYFRENRGKSQGRSQIGLLKRVFLCQGFRVLDSSSRTSEIPPRQTGVQGGGLPNSNRWHRH
jgi:hypothetical protein